MLRTIPAAIALLLTPAIAHAQANPNHKPAIDLARERGGLIYAYDQAAWHGTDDMLAKVSKPEEKIGGWIVDGPEASPTIIFFDRAAADPHAVYVAEFSGTRLVSSRVLGPGDDRSLSDERKAMITARQKGIQAWAKAKPLFCSDKSANTVVLPRERPDGPFLVYVLTPQTANGTYPLGGHFRVEIGADGRIGASRSFSKSCIAFTRSSGNEAMFFVTHLLDPTPTEIHVFTSLTSHLPLAVGTGKDFVWFVTGKSIEGQPIR